MPESIISGSGTQHPLVINNDGTVATFIPLMTKVDEVSSAITYIGNAAHGSNVGSAVWRIKKIVLVGTVTTISFADSVDTFTKIWNSRTGYSY